MKQYKRLIDYVLIIGTFTLAFLYSLRRMSDSDLWGHLKCGEYFFKKGTILKTYYFNCSWPDYPYLNHEWLFQAIIYKIYDYSGELGLVALQILLILLSFFILYKILRLYTGNLPLISFILSLGIIASSHRFALRPQHFSYVFLLYFLLSLHMYQRGKSRYAYFMPLFMILWVNMHAESLWGILVPAVFIGSEYIKTFGKGGMQRRDIRRIVIIFGLIVAASMINPFTYKTVFWPLIVMKEQFAGVEELLSPVTPGYFFFWTYFLVFVLATVFNLRRTDPTWFALGVIYAVVAWTANRGIPHFIFVSAPVVAVNLDGFYERRNIKTRNIAAYTYGFRILILSAIIYIIFSVVTSPLYLKKFDNIPYPEGAIRLLKAKNVKGNVFNSHGWGNYMIWNSYPLLRPYIDGRFFHKKFYDEYYYVLSVGAGWQDILSKYNITIVLMPYSNTDRGTLNDRLFASLHWRLVYWDDVSLLYMKDVGDNKKIIDGFGNNVINPDRQVYEYDERDPELSKKATMAAERGLLSAGQSSKALLLSATAYYNIPNYQMAVKRYEEALRYSRENNSWVFYKIALSYRYLGDLKKASEYLKKCLSLEPDFRDGKRLMNELTILQGVGQGP